MSSCNRKITSKTRKYLLVKSELNNLETFDSIYFRGKSHFEDDGTQNYLVYQTVSKYFKTVSNNDSNVNGTEIIKFKAKDSLKFQHIPCV